MKIYHSKDNWKRQATKHINWSREDLRLTAFHDETGYTKGMWQDTHSELTVTVS